MPTPLKNKHVVISAGPTREYWDPVRYFTNASSGAMGIALAERAKRLGARVTLVLGPIEPSRITALTRGISVVPVVSAWEMYEAVKKRLAGTDIFIGAAAVVDYRPAQFSKEKIKRHTPVLHLKLHGNPDIIAMVGHVPKKRPALVIGFALETGKMMEHAREKLFRKRMDWIVANRESNIGQAVGSAMMLSRWGHQTVLKKMSKTQLAERIWATVLG